MVVTSENLGAVMVRILARNARYVGSNHDLGTIFPIFITYTHGTYRTWVARSIHAVHLASYVYWVIYPDVLVYPILERLGY